MARKHDNNVIEQLYGNNDLNEIIKMKNTTEHAITGKQGIWDQGIKTF